MAEKQFYGCGEFPPEITAMLQQIRIENSLQQQVIGSTSRMYNLADSEDQYGTEHRMLVRDGSWYLYRDDHNSNDDAARVYENLNEDGV